MTLLDRVSKVPNKFVWEIVHRTGLPFSAVRALLIRGWTYDDGIDSVPKWIAPAHLLKK